jgi:hypothetical protein
MGYEEEIQSTGQYPWVEDEGSEMDGDELQIHPLQTKPYGI